MSSVRLYALAIALSVVAGGCVCYAQKSSIDPNASQRSEPLESRSVDSRLAKLVACEAWHKPLKTILADLSESTGVTLHAGYSLQDWQVRDRRMNIHVKGVTLAQLMNSIARTMKFRWSMNDGVTPPTYRLIADRNLLAGLQSEAARRQNAFKVEQMKRRAGLADALARVAEMSGSDLASLEESNPYLYLCASTGAAKLMTQLLSEDQRIKDAFLNADKNALIQTETFSQSTQQLCAKALQGYEKHDRAKALPTDLDGLFNYQFNIQMMAEPDERSQYRQLTNFGGLAAYIIRDDNGYHRMGLLRDPYAESTQAWARAVLAPPQESESRWSSYHESLDSMSAGERTRDIAYYMMYDPVAQHPDEPGLQGDVDLKITDEVSKTVADQVRECGEVASARLWYQAALRLIADSARLNIVSDSFGIVMDQPRMLPFKGKTQALLDKVGDTYLCNWEKQGPIVEIRRRDWFRRRSSQIPDEWVKPWRDELTKNAMLSMRSHAQMITLADDQIEENIKTDRILSKATGPSWDYGNQKGFLRLYLRLTDFQRGEIFSERGLDPHELNPDQWRCYTEMFNYGQRYAWNTEEFCDPDAGDVSISGRFENTAPDGSHFYTVTVLLTTADGSTKKDIWGITLHNVPAAKDQPKERSVTGR